MTPIHFDRSRLRGAGVREALKGEVPVKVQAPRVTRHLWFLILALIFGFLALACLYLAVNS